MDRVAQSDGRPHWRLIFGMCERIKTDCLPRISVVPCVGSWAAQGQLALAERRALRADVQSARAPRSKGRMKMQLEGGSLPRYLGKVKVGRWDVRRPR
jgi:hypothetical protein